MAFQFTCPHCFYKTLVDESVSGESGQCRNCGKLITIPAAPLSSASPSASEDAHSDSGVSGGAETPLKLDPLALVRRKRQTLVITRAISILAAIGVVAGLGIYFSWPVVKVLQQRRDRMRCMSHLSQIANALNNYAEQYGSYPPPVTYDSAGVAMHSWRVLILPQLGFPGLYGEYDFELPWDSPANLALLERCPNVFISPGDLASTYETNYFLVVGKGTIFPKSGPLSPDEITDGLENTLLVFESDANFNEWTKPVDIDISKLNPRIGAKGANTLGSTHPGGANAVFADERAAWLADDVSPKVINALISPAGNEPIDRTDFLPE